MKIALFLYFITITSAYYTDVDENIDIDGIMADPEKLQPYLDCYLDRQPCTKQAAVYKSHIAEFVSNGCEKCDDKFKHIIEEFLLNIAMRFPNEMEQIKAKYDPTGVKLGKLAYEVSKY